MRKERAYLKVSSIVANEGQIPWLPRNPRQWTQADIDNTARSIEEDPDFLEDRPLLVVQLDESKWLVFAGNLRREGAKKDKMKTVPVVIYYPETDEDRMTIKRRAMKDNGSFGAWDYDALANEWDDLPLSDWGVPSWETSKNVDLSALGIETIAATGESVSGYSAITFLFKREDADVVKKWINNNGGKEKLAAEMVKICRDVEVK